MNDWLDVVVIGAGQAGLAAGYYLQRARFSFQILESSSEISGSWSHYYRSLRLFSPARYSSLPGLRFPGDPTRYPTRNEVMAYLRQYAHHFQLPVVLNSQVVSVRRYGDGFVVETEKRPYFARAVICATGAFNQPIIPTIPGLDQFTGTILHSYNYQHPEIFREQRVVVVGAGNSAVQIAAELGQVAHTTLASLHPIRWQAQKVWGFDVHFWARVLRIDTSSTLPPSERTVIDSGNYRAGMERGVFDRQPMFTSFSEKGVVWQDDTTESVDTVIFATGYRPNLDFVAGLDIFDEQGHVAQVNGASSKVMGLYFNGLAFQRNHASATLRGSGPDAAYMVQQIQAVLRPSLAQQVWQAINGRFFIPLRNGYCKQFCQPVSQS